MHKIRLDDSWLNHLTNIPVGFTRKSSYIHTFWEITCQKYYVFCWQGVRTHLTQLVSLRHCPEMTYKVLSGTLSLYTLLLLLLLLLLLSYFQWQNYSPYTLVLATINGLWETSRAISAVAELSLHISFQLLLTLVMNVVIHLVYHLAW